MHPDVIEVDRAEQWASPPSFVQKQFWARGHRHSIVFLCSANRGLSPCRHGATQSFLVFHIKARISLSFLLTLPPLALLVSRRCTWRTTLLCTLLAACRRRPPQKSSSRYAVSMCRFPTLSPRLLAIPVELMIPTPLLFCSFSASQEPS